MALAIFDLDNSLIRGDSDHGWGQFLVSQGLVDADAVAAANDRFLVQYNEGRLDIHEYLEFALSYIAGKTPAELAPLRQQFMAEVVEPMILPKAEALLQQHREAGDTLLIITATNQFVTEPIAERLGVPNLIACNVELHNGRYTGKPQGTPSFQHGKVERLNDWLTGHDAQLAGAWFYSDSHNDLPLLQRVDNPVAVNPDPKLKQIAVESGWQILDLRA